LKPKPKPKNSRMNPSRIAIGADVGGSHISCAAIDLIQGRVIAETEQRAPVNNGGSAAEIFRQWALALNASIAALPAESLVGIGFAMPGPFDYRDGISKMQ
ncbi:hypothetical protein RZS08_04980, partial [Arthrospira platensis SPKY1]|nr:hypothetical protein [Arthrospira platensis SPKY1]